MLWRGSAQDSSHRPILPERDEIHQGLCSVARVHADASVDHDGHAPGTVAHDHLA